MTFPARIQETGLERFDLFRELEQMRRGMDEFFGSFGRRFPTLRLMEREAWTPMVDVYKEKDEFVVRADLPGVEKKDVKVWAANEVLTIEGERKAEKKIEDENFFCREGMYGKFLRRIGLPAGTKPEDIEAEFHDGVLEVRLPLTEKVAAIEVPIEG